MNIEVKLFGNYRAYLPPKSKNYSCWLELENGSRAEDVLRRLNIPDDLSMIIVRNSNICDKSEPLHDGDKIAILPMISGG